MNLSNPIQQVALTFVREKVRQRIYKNQGRKRTKSVGLGTEQAMRECLSAELEESGFNVRSKSFSTHPVSLALSKINLLEAGLKNLESYLAKLKDVWAQCDLCIEKGNEISILGEVKTTLSSSPNICDLINKNITAIKLLNVRPLSVVFYPDTKPTSLKEKHLSLVDGLRDSGRLTDDDHYILKDCFFVLTTIGWETGLKKRTKGIHNTDHGEIDSIIEQHELLQDADIDFNEWERLKAYVKNG